MKTFKEVIQLVEREYDKQREMQNGKSSPFTQDGEVINGWWCHTTIHPPSQQMDRRPDFSKEDVKKLYTNITKKLNTFTKKTPAEYLFYSKSLHQSVVADVSFDGIHSQTKKMNAKNMPELRLVTFLEKDKNEARLSAAGKKTAKVVVEGLEHELEVVEVE